ncbi:MULTISPECIES: hypothetical protein [unclassified Anabaena]|uniref:hypothetical protein n=1 Tax=unclassified Anabaena TaxID=2619674 RepID=UPI00082D53B3|nr:MULTISPECIES: hypothetical protein [unclassified Anabaena]
MKQPYLSPDDLPTQRTTLISEILISQLEEATKKKFYVTCRHSVRILLSSCHWYFKVNGGILMLIMVCHDIESYQNIMMNVPYLAKKLKLFANNARISLSSPVNQGIPWVVSINQVLSGEDGYST